MSDKIAPTDHPILDLLARRWSPYAFADREVEPETLQSLFEAARWAPSCYNEQPWRFLVAARNDAAGFERLLGCLVEFNQGWARRAPVLALSVAATRFARNDKPNRHAYHDLGMAVENLVIQAGSMDLHVHQMGGFDMEKAREDCAIPEGYDPVAMIALGYRGDPADLSGPLAEREVAPRERKPLGEFVFSSRWGDASSIL
jgi:nitroreductase